MNVFAEVENSVKAAALAEFGLTLKNKRIEAGYARGNKFAQKVSEVHPLSSQYLSQIERGYSHPKRGMVVPSDKLLDAVGAVLNWPRSEMDRLLAGAYGDRKDVQTRLGELITKALSKLSREDMVELHGLLDIVYNQLADADQEGEYDRAPDEK